MTALVTPAELDEAEATLDAPTDAPGLLLWLDERAERLALMRLQLEQDASAEKLRRARWAARQEEAAARIARVEADMRRAVESQRATIMPGATKSRTLPGGARLAFRRRPLRLTVANGDALFAWAQAHNMARTVMVADMD